MSTDSILFENVNTDTIHGVELYVLHLTALLETLFHLPGTRHCTYYYRISFLAHILRFSVYNEISGVFRDTQTIALVDFRRARAGIHILTIINQVFVAQ